MRLKMTAVLASTLILLVGCGSNEPEAPGLEEPQTAQGWSFSTDKDKMTDVVRGIAALESADGSAEHNGAHAQLVLKCDPPAGASSVYAEFITPEYLGEDSSAQISNVRDMSYRFDGREAVQSAVGYGENSAIITAHDLTGPLWLTTLRNAHRLAIRLVDFRFHPVEYSFDLRDVRDQMNRVARVCGDTRLLEGANAK